ncbi:MAG: cytochrome C [Spirochaetaceae bacterium]|nr:cytochrome C [Spirochaetaceae bacterium]|tara:strand:+ start:19032 stop:19580 length:549 start_codon:yes stop_codon:yes gene_type:complete
MADFQEVRDDEEIYEGRGWLPTWWTLMLIAGIVFGVVYVLWTHGLEGWDQEKGYEQEVADYQKQFPDAMNLNKISLTEEGVNPLRGDAEAIAAGEGHFQAKCAACHGNDAKGRVGPDLTDTTWLHGNSDEVVYGLVMNGIQGEQKKLDTGGNMPAHNRSLGSTKVLQVMAWMAKMNPSLKSK